LDLFEILVPLFYKLHFIWATISQKN